MNLVVVLVMFLFCGLTLAEESPADTETTLSGYHHYVLGLQGQLGAINKKLGALENRLKETENHIEDQKRKEGYRVVFSASADGGGRIGPFKTDTTLVYNKVITNIGSAYNQHTGIFTAPVRGVYYFSFFYHAGGEYIVFLSLMKNNELVGTTSDHSSSFDTADNGGNAVFVQLQQGDHVFVRMRSNSHIWATHRFTTFNGFLVSPS
nr:complement C1q-like protein 4 [Monopterus albus]